MFNDIEAGKFPTWKVYIVSFRTLLLQRKFSNRINQQTMTPEQAEKFRYNILDLTKIWPHADFPLRPIGKLVLNENPQNYFNEIEQVCMFAINLTETYIQSSRLLSLLPTSFHISSPPLTLSSNRVCSPTPIPTVTVLVPTTSSCQSTSLSCLLSTSSALAR